MHGGAMWRAASVLPHSERGSFEDPGEVGFVRALGVTWDLSESVRQLAALRHVDGARVTFSRGDEGLGLLDEPVSLASCGSGRSKPAVLGSGLRLPKKRESDDNGSGETERNENGGIEERLHVLLVSFHVDHADRRRRTNACVSFG